MSIHHHITNGPDRTVLCHMDSICQFLWFQNFFSHLTTLNIPMKKKKIYIYIWTSESIFFAILSASIVKLSCSNFSINTEIIGRPKFLDFYSCKNADKLLVWNLEAVKFLHIRTPEKFAVIPIKVKRSGSTIQQCIQKDAHERQTV